MVVRKLRYRTVQCAAIGARQGCKTSQPLLRRRHQHNTWTSTRTAQAAYEYFCLPATSYGACKDKIEHKLALSSPSATSSTFLPYTATKPTSIAITIRKLMKAILFLSVLSSVLPHTVSASTACSDESAFFNNDRWKVVLDYCM